MKNIKVTYKKLNKIYGIAHCGYNSIEIDSRIRGKKLLEILLHEATHIILPAEEEEEVERISIALTKLLWKEGYRKIDNDNSIPLQDGTK